MGPILQQLVTLAGVLVGAGATFAATTRIERIKWRRGIESRWDDKRLNAYSDYANALKAFMEVLFQMAVEQGLPNLTAPADGPVGRNALAEAEAERTIKWEKVLLLGSQESIAACRRWHKAAYEFCYFVLGENSDHLEYLRLYEVMGTFRDEFYSCARADLGVRGANLPAGDGIWLPPHQRHLLSQTVEDAPGEHACDTQVDTESTAKSGYGT